jgi:hypothetical protein
VLATVRSCLAGQRALGGRRWRWRLTLAPRPGAGLKAKVSGLIFVDSDDGEGMSATAGGEGSAETRASWVASDPLPSSRWTLLQ